ncbi:MAG: hypothetical protein JOZ19_15515 [Rubrobacter sp.]|nr:hypothetical protein [Rubrobacter sp.]
MPQNFDPLPGDPIYLFEQEYVVQPHPQAPYLPYRQKAGRARVYQLLNKEDQYFALKEFKKRYRKPALIDSYKNLHRVENFEGLRAAKRRIVLPSDPTAKRYPSLEYAMLMPWIHGKTWFDVLGQTREGESYPDLSIAIELCDRFLEIMEALEKAGMAHTDISPGNVMVGFDPIDVQLLDLEEMYMPGVDAPPEQNTGSAGYRHRSGETTWKPEGDRYAAAVLAAEMLILAKPALARKATDEGFFRGNCEAPEGKARFKDVRPWLKKVSPEFAKVFERSWFAKSLEGCPRISELREPIKKLTNSSVEPSVLSDPGVVWKLLGAQENQDSSMGTPLVSESEKLAATEQRVTNDKSHPKRAETPRSTQPSAESKEAVKTPQEIPVVGSGALKRLPKRLIGASVAFLILITAVGVGVWSTMYASTISSELRLVLGALHDRLAGHQRQAQTTRRLQRSVRLT